MHAAQAEVKSEATSPVSPAAALRPGLVLQRCSCGGQCPACQAKRLLQRQRAEARLGAAPAGVEAVLSSPGLPLDSGARTWAEARLGHDFSQVRIHTDAPAAASASAVQARAYTVGQHVVFSGGQYAPETPAGRHLLAHELTHVLQQRSGAVGAMAGIDPDPGAEHAAERTAAAVLRGGTPAPVQPTPVRLARFSDTGHHVIEEAALSSAGFTPEQVRGVERGNIQRDYSQLGTVGNLALLCNPQGFGGYTPVEHFDNFAYDAVTSQWRSRGAPAGVSAGRTPIQYIADELGALGRLGMTSEGLRHLGNAFHTVEDFFAHSNFVELIQGDVSHGEELVTGSFGSADATASLSHTLAEISPPSTAGSFRQTADAATARTEPHSHSHLAHDHPSDHNYEQARLLAALVIADLGADVLAAMRNPAAPQPPRTPEERQQQLTQVVLGKVTRYLRPPQPNDHWWEQLRSSGGDAMQHRLEETERRTPVTVNQCIFSPLRNLEASQGSSIHIPLGVAVPVQVGGSQVWIQAGGGVITGPLPLDRTGRDTGSGALFGGAQVTAHF